MELGFTGAQGYCALGLTPMLDEAPTKHRSAAGGRSPRGLTASEISIDVHIKHFWKGLPLVDINQSGQSSEVSSKPLQLLKGALVWHAKLSAQLFARERNVRPVLGQVVTASSEGTVHCGVGWC